MGREKGQRVSRLNFTGTALKIDYISGQGDNGLCHYRVKELYM